MGRLIRIPELGMPITQHALIALRESIISFTSRPLAILYVDIAKSYDSQYNGKRQKPDVDAMTGHIFGSVEKRSAMFAREQIGKTYAAPGR